ncbi:flagellar protein FlgN [Bordetella genomosp. 12]|uniref:Flagellar protein FlgN n=1 Tax=Bordetella genomosp. 12 TaxID=463035 RepID=A0A261VM40_9BORD|nr:flagellar protein FlgN [Bordetella genomosp. 12]
MPAALARCLETETALIEQFLSALQAESAALLDRKAAQALQDAAQHKEALADQLVAASQERDRILAAMALAPGHAGTDAAAGAHAELAPLWQRLQDHAAQARDANQRNAILLEVNLRYTEQTLQALRRLGSQNTTTYDAQGRGRPLGGASRAIVAT